MSVSKMTLIYCDGGEECPNGGCYCDSDASHETAAVQRASFPNNGWLHRGGKDYCAACAKRLFNHGDGKEA